MTPSLTLRFECNQSSEIKLLSVLTPQFSRFRSFGLFRFRINSEMRVLKTFGRASWAGDQPVTKRIYLRRTTQHTKMPTIHTQLLALNESVTGVVTVTE
jgi:hypothetical protein